jgi:hypothetical protein
MGIAAANAGGAPAPENLFAQEVRFGVVMYGGVSLAIYINGVTNELYEMALATPKAGDQRNSGKTRDVYRKASFLLRDTALRNRYLAYLENPNTEDPFGEAAPPNADQRTRFVVDTIAGTSAGGINGLFLAKALVNGQEFAPLKQLWITEGDIDTLLNDQTSYDGLTFAETGSPPQSLLNSDRMYVKLLGALRNMKRSSRPPAMVLHRWSMKSTCMSRRRIFEEPWCRCGCSTRSFTRSGTSRFITSSMHRPARRRTTIFRTTKVLFLPSPPAARRRSRSPSSR